MSVRKWGNLSRDITAQLERWKERLIQLGVAESAAEKMTDKMWRVYAQVLIDSQEHQPTRKPKSGHQRPHTNA